MKNLPSIEIHPAVYWTIAGSFLLACAVFVPDRPGFGYTLVRTALVVVSVMMMTRKDREPPTPAPIVTAMRAVHRTYALDGNIPTDLGQLGASITTRAGTVVDYLDEHTGDRALAAKAMPSLIAKGRP
jgi:hypothetical protein